MTLAARILNSNGDGEIPSHEFGAVLSGWFIGDWPRSKVLTSFRNIMDSSYPDLTAAEEAELDALKTHFDGLPNPDAQNKFFIKVERYSILLQHEEMTAAQWEGFLGL